MGIIDSNSKDFFKQSGIALCILAFVGILIYNSNSNLDKKRKQQLEMLNSENQPEEKIVVGKIYKIVSGKNYTGAKFTYYLDGKLAVEEDDIPNYDESLLGRFFRVSFSSKAHKEVALLTDYEVTDTQTLKKAGFRLKTKYRFDISLGKYLQYKEYE
ncbi:MAG: hypothetical protein KAY31_01815 [Flavobacterium sp.]|nr:hypothetical protein [Flavobacterium sp.]